jgi:hypothetical protein
MPQWRAMQQNWLQSFDDASASNLDVVALLRTRLPANALVTPRPEDIEEIRKMAAVNNGQPVSLANVMTDALEMEADDPQFVPILQGLNDALRRDPNGCPPVPVVFCCAKRCRLTWAMCRHSAPGAPFHSRHGNR